MPATVTQIAKEAGVSVSLVSRLLRGDPNARVSDHRRQEILRIKDRLGGVSPRKAARNSTRSSVVLTPVNRIYSPEWLQDNVLSSRRMRSMEAAMRDQNMRMHFVFLDEAEMTQSLGQSIYHGDCDGLLLLDESIVYEWLAEFLKTRHFPHVSTHFPAEQYRVNTVHSHEPDGFRQAVEHLRDLGHRDIGFVGMKQSYRHPLAIAAIAAAGLPINDQHHCWLDPLPEPTADTRVGLRRNACDAASSWLKCDPAATALICSNDQIAHGVIDAMHAQGLTPGKDLSVVGHGNHEGREPELVENPVITTIDSPVDEVGRRAVEIFLNQIERGQTQVVHERIPVNLIVRSTTGPVRDQ